MHVKYNNLRSLQLYHVMLGVVLPLPTAMVAKAAREKFGDVSVYSNV